MFENVGIIKLYNKSFGWVDGSQRYLDEPFINLDPIVQTKVRDWLAEYVKKGGTVFLNTHLLENAQRLCDRAAIIHNGKVVAQGTPTNLIQNIDARNVYFGDSFKII